MLGAKILHNNVKFRFMGKIGNLENTCGYYHL
jgi:hypothetical protein